MNPDSGEASSGAVRNLIERAESYRTAFARATLVTGIVATLAAVGIHLNDQTKFSFGHAIGAREFAAIWLGVLILSMLAPLLFFARDAHRTGRPFVSPESKLALNQMKPFPIIPAAFTGWFFTTGYLGAQELDLVVIWIAFYGLTLLSVAFFAPRGIVALGWAFLITSLCVPATINLIETYFSIDVPNVLMGLTFGAYHLVYAAFNWQRPTNQSASKNRDM